MNNNLGVFYRHRNENYYIGERVIIDTVEDGEVVSYEGRITDFVLEAKRGICSVGYTTPATIYSTEFMKIKEIILDNSTRYHSNIVKLNVNRVVDICMKQEGI